MAARAGDGLMDGAAFRAAVEKSFHKAGTAAILHLDLDRFAEVNANAGRDAGDKVIAATLATLRKWAEQQRWALGRIGGDEFALYARDIPLEHAFLKAEKLRQELNAALAKAAPKPLKVTASIGVAGAPRDAKTPQELIQKADLALYAAKEQGSDTVALAPGDEMVLKSSYYTTSQLGRLKALAERQKKKESVLLREALDDLLRKHDRS